MIIYLLRNTVNGKCYVGQTSKSLARRLNQHRRDANRRFQPLYLAIQKYGWDVFESEILEECIDEADLDMAERQWIRIYGSLAPGGYNLETGGCLNKRHSSESIQRMKAAKAGTTPSPEARLAASKANKGRSLTADHRAKMSAVRKGRPLSEAHREALSGRPRSPDHCAALSKALKGKKRSAAARENMSRAALKRHADRKAKMQAEEQ